MGGMRLAAAHGRVILLLYISASARDYRRFPSTPRDFRPGSRRPFFSRLFCGAAQRATTHNTKGAANYPLGEDSERGDAETADEQRSFSH